MVERQIKELEQQVRIDTLTGLPNRKQFDEDIINQIENKPTKRRRVEDEWLSKSISVIFFDVDDFKKINDEQGHITGDKVLQMLANIFKQRLRREDVVYRYGGDEFVGILIENALSTNGGDEKDESTLAQKTTSTWILNAIKKHNERNSEIKLPSVTMGYATQRDKDDVNSLIERADKDLREKKEKKGVGRINK